MADIVCDCSELCNCNVKIDSNLFEITDFKKCVYCNCYFSRMDFPKTFDRQLTCGCVVCEGIRRKELFKKRTGRIKREV
ncbi:hypothetical protein J4209_01350 [Candidatus Woesearchaeota archaeon]|nr:hypothetical protein [Candidatus Woesearchaeota archaeon]